MYIFSRCSLKTPMLEGLLNVVIATSRFVKKACNNRFVPEFVFSTFKEISALLGVYAYETRKERKTKQN